MIAEDLRSISNMYSKPTNEDVKVLTNLMMNKAIERAENGYFFVGGEIKARKIKVSPSQRDLLAKLVTNRLFELGFIVHYVDYSDLNKEYSFSFNWNSERSKP